MAAVDTNEVKKENQSQHVKIDRRPKRKKPGFHEEMFDETKYYFKKGLRFVYPYPFTFTAHIKKRWLNLKLIELFEREFHMETIEYYENAIKIGKIKVNDQIVTRDRKLTSKDILKTIVHRHEPPVVHEPFEFLQNDQDMIVINKPASIPVHPCGRYRHNTVVFILGKDHGLERLHTIHRIDRLTSGILMFAKTPEKAKAMETAVHGRNVEKVYYARVEGDFPSESIVVEEPLLTMSHKIGVCQVHVDGKPCSTTFHKISFNGKSSLVRCLPRTGRMHQIRVHLQWLGHPILNDPIYNHATAWGEGGGKKGTEIDVKKVVAELIRTRKDKSYDDATGGQDENRATAKSEKDNNNHRQSKKLKTDDGGSVEVKTEITSNSSNSIDADANQKSKVQNGCSLKGVRETDNIKTNGTSDKLSHLNIQKANSTECETNSTTESETSAMENKVKDLSTLKCEENSNKESVAEKREGSSGKEGEGKLTKRDFKNITNTTESNGKIKENTAREGSEETTAMEGREETTAMEGEIEEEEESYTSLDIGEQYHDPTCTECKRAWKLPKQSELVMYLHAHSYKGPGFEYKTTLPEWAKDDWLRD
ncbi:pseudouridylate synthase RPUSD2-like [Clytia hemisphaerica]|uniref:Pseudouridine synthase RsuA/RluA-like domain-containing protein n=1 Tax=Clytia hemisphaerica TaxID=252671 RepID=A0A7M5XBU5_9CNID